MRVLCNKPGRSASCADKRRGPFRLEPAALRTNILAMSSCACQLRRIRQALVGPGAPLRKERQCGQADEPRQCYLATPRVVSCYSQNNTRTRLTRLTPVAEQISEASQTTPWVPSVHLPPLQGLLERPLWESCKSGLAGIAFRCQEGDVGCLMGLRLLMASSTDTPYLATTQVSGWSRLQA